MRERTDVLTFKVCLQQRPSKVTWNYTWNLMLRTWITPKYQEIEKRSKIIQVNQFLTWLTRLCIFYFIQCQVPISNDRLMSWSWRLVGWSCWGKWLSGWSIDSQPLKTQRIMNSDSDTPTQTFYIHITKNNSLRNVIRSQYLKHTGHVCHCPNTMLTKNMLFVK